MDKKLKIKYVIKIDLHFYQPLPFLHYRTTSKSITRSVLWYILSRFKLVTKVLEQRLVLKAKIFWVFHKNCVFYFRRAKWRNSAWSRTRAWSTPAPTSSRTSSPTRTQTKTFHTDRTTFSNASFTSWKTWIVVW
jgi:hypothetical protein